MEIRWLGEVEPTFNPRSIPLSTLPLSAYPWREDFHHDIAQSGWAPVKLGVDFGGVFSKAPEQAKFIFGPEGRGQR